MANKKVRALDTLHVSSVQADPLRPGAEFTVEESVADSLIRRGLAESADGGTRRAKAPRNKKAAEPANKGNAASE